MVLQPQVVAAAADTTRVNLDNQELPDNLALLVLQAALAHQVAQVDQADQVIIRTK